MAEDSIMFTLKKRIVGGTFYWYIDYNIVKNLELEKYDKLTVKLLSKAKDGI